MYDPETDAVSPPTSTKGSGQKWREGAATKRYVQDTMEVLAYLRAPLRLLSPWAAHRRIGAVAMLEALTLFNDAMQHNPCWNAPAVPEPDLIAAARGRAVAPGLQRGLRMWMNCMADPAHREYWCRRAFERTDATIEREYFAVLHHAEAAMLLLFDTGFTPTASGKEMAARLRNHPLDMRLLEEIKDLKARPYY